MKKRGGEYRGTLKARINKLYGGPGKMGSKKRNRNK